MGVPDAQIHPNATGPAADLVEKHKGAADVKFYAGWFCPYVQRTWMALEEKGIAYQYIEINPYHKDAEFLRINPKGLVPAIEYNGIALAESNILVELLEDAFPESRVKLLPSEPAARALVRMQIDFIGKRIVPAYFRLLMAHEQPDVQKTSRGDLAAALKELMTTYIDKSQTHSGPFLGGKDLNAADVSLAPWVERMKYLDEERGGPLTAEETGSTYLKYRENMLARPSLVNTTSNKEHYDPIYRRYLHNEAQSDAAKATRSGRAIP